MPFMDNVFGENIPTDWTAFYQEWLARYQAKQFTGTVACRCSKSVIGTGDWGMWHGCSKTAKVTRLVNQYGIVAGPRGFHETDSISYKSFCGTHDPVAIKERSEKKYAEEKRFRDAQLERQRTRENRASLIAAAVGHLTDAQLTELASKKNALLALLGE